jgi:hypothetical protein
MLVSFSQKPGQKAGSKSMANPDSDQLFGQTYTPHTYLDNSLQLTRPALAGFYSPLIRNWGSSHTRWAFTWSIQHVGSPRNIPEAEVSNALHHQDGLPLIAGEAYRNRHQTLPLDELQTFSREPGLRALLETSRPTQDMATPCITSTSASFFAASHAQHSNYSSHVGQSKGPTFFSSPRRNLYLCVRLHHDARSLSTKCRG